MQDSAPAAVASRPRFSRPVKPRAERIRGTLVRVRDEGYGFIRPDAGPPDFYVAVSSFRDRGDFRPGRRVEFTPGVAHRSEDGGRSKAAPAWDVAGIADAPEEAS